RGHGLVDRETRQSMTPPTASRPPPQHELRAGEENGTPPLLELVSVSKTYPGVRALDRVSLRLERGEGLALIGENGAGKSALMKILGGVVEPSEGTIRIDGVAHPSLTVAAAMAAGIAFVHQELNLFDNLDVAANVMIGREPLLARPFKLPFKLPL